MKSVIAWRAVCLLFVHAFGSRINCYSNESDLKASHLLPLISSMHILVGLFSRTDARQYFCEMSNIIESLSLSVILCSVHMINKLTRVFCFRFSKTSSFSWKISKEETTSLID